MRRGVNRVLFAHQSADLYGADRVLLESVEAFRAAGWSVVVTVPAGGPLLDPLRELGAEVVVLATLVLRKTLLRPRAIVKVLRRGPGDLIRAVRAVRAADADLVYVNTITIPLWLVAARIARVPVLVHVHEAERDLPRAVRSALALPLLLARTVVVNSRASAAEVRAAIPRLARRIHLVYNGVRGPDAVVAAVLEAPDPIRLVLVGRLSPRKGTDIAIAALAQLRQRGHRATLELVGAVYPGYEWYQRELSALIAAAGVEDSVCFSGFCASVWPAYARADVALVPSRIEPFGNVAVEAQLAGRPVLVSAVQGLIEASASAGMPLRSSTWGVLPPAWPRSDRRLFECEWTERSDGTRYRYGRLRGPRVDMRLVAPGPQMPRRRRSGGAPSARAAPGG
jgi:glycosyltransferase involved in cell wall biosynthesis